MYKCEWCKNAITHEMYSAIDGEFCNGDCYSKWLLTYHGLGYSTTVSEHKKYMKELGEMMKW